MTLKVTKIIIPADNQIAKCIAISANFRAFTYNLTKCLEYYREWEREYSNSPSDTFRACLDNARFLATKEARSFERLASNMPEYSQHPDFIKAHNVYTEIMALKE